MTGSRSLQVEKRCRRPGAGRSADAARRRTRDRSARRARSPPAARRLHASRRGRARRGIHGRDSAVNGSPELLDAPPRATVPRPCGRSRRELPRGTKLPLRTLARRAGRDRASLFGLHLHRLAKRAAGCETRSYSILLGRRSSARVVCSPRSCSRAGAGLRAWMREMGPILAAAVVAARRCGRSITSGLRWLPLPYFPSPPACCRA